MYHNYVILHLIVFILKQLLSTIMNYMQTLCFSAVICIGASMGKSLSFITYVL